MMHESSTIDFAGQIDKWDGHQAGVRALACSASGGLVASVDTDRRISIWRDGAKVQLISPFPFWDLFPSGRRVYSLAFSLDSSLLFVGMTDRLDAYEVETGRRAWRFRGPKVLAFLPSSPVGLAVNPATGDLAAGFDDGHLGIWTPTGSCRAFWFDDQAPRRLGFSADGSRLIGTDFYSICIWDVVSHAKVARHMSEEKYPALAVSPVADVTAARTLRELAIFQSDTGQDLARFPVDAGLPLLALSPTSPMAAYSNGDELRFCSFEGQLLGRGALAESPALSLAFSGDGTQVLAGCRDGSIRVFQAPGGTPQGSKAKFVPPALG